MNRSSWAARWFGSAVALAIVATASFGAATTPPQAGAKPAAAPKYIGAEKCKNCHNSPKSGEQYAKWQKEKHAKAFERLASDEAKKAGKEKGVDDPQKAEQCVKCHTTAAKEPDTALMKGFNRQGGVQCESCHGPGEKHLKARMAAAASAGEDAGDARQEIGKDEIVAHPDVKTCETCHNKESPSYKPFCFKHRFAEIDHTDPRDTKRKAERDAELEKMTCSCPAGEKK
jgi:hypothetical protein